MLCPSVQNDCLTERQPSLKDGQEKMARSPRAIEAAVSWALSTAACNCDRERLLWMVGVARLQVAGLSCKPRLPLSTRLIEAVCWLAVACHRSCLLVCSELLSRATAENMLLDGRWLLAPQLRCQHYPTECQTSCVVVGPWFGLD